MRQGKTSDFTAFGESPGDLFNVRISETLERFSRSMVVTGSRLPKTTAKYEQIMRRFIGFAGDKVIGELKVGDFGKFKYDMVVSKKKSSTIATAMSVFCKYASFLKDAFSEGFGPRGDQDDEAQGPPDLARGPRKMGDR